jgi:hypothetical protein
LFLKNILAFEENYANSKVVSMFDYLGRPEIKKAAEIEDGEMELALTGLMNRLFCKNITVDFGNLTDARAKYSFITDELFLHQMNEVNMPGMFFHFLYEEFNPDHEADIKRRTLEFISDWFEQTMGKFSWELSDTVVLADGKMVPKEKVLEKFRLIFESYTCFKNCQFLIDSIHFELKEEPGKGIGHVDGAVKYQAVLENGETTTIEGPFKLFLAMEHNCWRIFYFVFPGFEW